MIFSPGLFFPFPLYSFRLAQTTYMRCNPEVSLLCSQVTGSHLFPRFQPLKHISLSFPSAFLWRGGSWVVKQRRHRFFFPKTRSLTPTFLSPGGGRPLQPRCPVTATRMLRYGFPSSGHGGCQEDPAAEREGRLSKSTLQHHAPVKLRRGPVRSTAFHFP